MIELVGMGNALIDVLQEIPEDFLAQTSYHKSSMNLVDLDEAQALYDHISTLKLPRRMVSGGSLGNAMAVYAGFGGKAGFIGKLGKDEMGDIFHQNMLDVGLEMSKTPRHKTLATGFCQVLITPDRERTMVTTLGAANTLAPIDLDLTMIKKANHIYLEGYLFDREDAKASFLEAAKLAHQQGNKVALTLSDSFCVDRHFDDFKALVNGHVDILFANEEEAKCLHQSNDFDELITKSRELNMMSIITRSALGAVVIDGAKTTYIPAIKVSDLKDMTGAGDAFAAGFLFGHIHGLSNEKSGELGATIASHVISIIGGRPTLDLKALANDFLNYT